jgi:hypothetical protein
MSLINIGAGISSAGAAISATAGQAALNAQKADLETQMAVLADQLSTRRETGLETLRQSGQMNLETQRAASATDLAKTQAGLNVSTAAQEAQNAAALTTKLGSDPAYLAAQKALASVDPTKMAQAAEAQNQAALLAQQTKSATEVHDARQAIIDEQSKPNPDPAKLKSLNDNFTTLLTAPQAAAAMRTAAVANARINEDAAARAATDLNVATAKLQDPNISGDATARAALQANVKNLSDRVKTLNQAADDARRTANGFFGGGKPVDQGPDPAAAQSAPAAGGLINQSAPR